MTALLGGGVATTVALSANAFDGAYALSRYRRHMQSKRGTLGYRQTG